MRRSRVVVNLLLTEVREDLFNALLQRAGEIGADDLDD